jgi:serine/threonine protein phosphatase PrpC
MTFDDSETVLIPSDPPSMQIAVDLGAATHSGHIRTNNEDSYLVLRASRSFELLLTNMHADEVPTWAAERAYGMVIADGMGGCAAGEVASHQALRAVAEHVLHTADWILRDPDVNADKIEDRIEERFAAANDSVRRQSERNPRWIGMGTTMTLATISGSRLFLGHVGDSRAYLLRGEQLQILTRDHSFAQAMADAGTISREEAAAHRMRNVLLRFLGGDSSRADLRHLRLASGDQLLLCTDGLNDMVREPEISSILQAASSAQAACDQLIAAALEAGGKDNVTVVLARFLWPVATRSEP